MSLVCWLTVFLVQLNLQPQGVTGLDQGVTVRALRIFGVADIVGDVCRTV